MTRFALALLLAIPALADDETACATLGRVLRAARDSGAIERVTRERHFVYTDVLSDGARTENTLLLVTVRGRLRDHALELVTTYRGNERDGTAFQLDQGWVVGLEDGRVRTGRREERSNDRLRSTIAGVVTRFDGQLCYDTRRIFDGGEQCTGRGEWSDALIPEPFALFVLPVLLDQGVPATLRYRHVTPTPGLTRSFTLTVGSPDGAGRRLLRRASLTITVESDRVLDVIDTETGETRHRAIDARELAKLKRALRLDREAARMARVVHELHAAWEAAWQALAPR